MIFGATSGKGGLGQYIFENRNELYTDKAFAGLSAAILIGLQAKNIGFHSLERGTVRRWGNAARIRRRLDSCVHARRRAWRTSTRSEVVMDWLDLLTAVLAVIAAVASLMFPLQRGQPGDPEGRERWRQ